MMERERTLLLAAFDDLPAAQRAVDDLRQAGFAAGDVGLATCGGEVSEGGPRAVPTEGAGPEAGAAVGGVTWGGAPGGYIPGLGVVTASGVLSTLLTGAATGTVSGLREDLTDKGIPEGEARFYDAAFRDGRPILAVRAGARRGQVEEILRRRGARRAEAT